MVDKIKEFQGEYRWLSNFWKAPQEISGRTYFCNEQWYVMNKCEDFHDEIMSATTPAEVKRLGRKCKMRENWDNIKISVMRVGLNAKFTQNPDLKKKLLDTGNSILEEGNQWGDFYWGCNLDTKKGEIGKGKNHLGRLLMKLREELRKEAGILGF